MKLNYLKDMLVSSPDLPGLCTVQLIIHIQPSFSAIVAPVNSSKFAALVRVKCSCQGKKGTFDG